MIVMTVFPFCRTIQGHLYIFYVEKHIALMVGVLLGKLFRIRIKRRKKKLYWVGRLCLKNIPKRRHVECRWRDDNFPIFYIKAD